MNSRFLRMEATRISMSVGKLKDAKSTAGSATGSVELTLMLARESGLSSVMGISEAVFQPVSWTEVVFDA